jgi:serine/threonine protein kinase
VTRVPLDDLSDCVVKEERHPGGLRRLLKALGGSRAARTRRAIDLLIERGLPAPAWLGSIQEPARSVAFVRHVRGPTLSEALAEAERPRARELAVAAVELAAALRRSGLATRDLKPTNVIVDAHDRLVLVDLDDLRPSRAPRYVWRNLASLDAYAQLGPRPLGVAARLAAARVYGTRRGVPVEEVLAQALPRSRAKRRRLKGSRQP